MVCVWFISIWDKNIRKIVRAVKELILKYNFQILCNKIGNTI